MTSEPAGSADDPVIEIFYGPLTQFRELVGEDPTENFVELLFKQDEERRVQLLRIEGADADDEAEVRPRPARVIAESDDYASVLPHVIQNFMHHVRTINPEHLFLHNPPAHVRDQLLRALPNSTTASSYTYPTVTRETLRKFRDGYADHLAGQTRAQQEVLASMFSLTREGRRNPVVLLFYGPSGVGKTQTAQFINSLLDGELMRQQFSMFQSEQFASYVFGGTHSDGSLARDLLNRESGVILIDEFDKANPLFRTAFYQLFEDGKFKDKNYDLEVGPALIICTANYMSEDEVEQALGDALMSRFDALIGFDPLTADEMLQVIEWTVDSELAKLPPDEKAHLSRDGLLEMFSVLPKQTANVRHLGKLIEQTIALMLVQVVLGAH